MQVNKGNQEGLFRGAIMQSGGPVPVGDIEHGQPYYDALVKNTGCDKSYDTLECLRKVPYIKFKYAMDISPNFFAYQVKADASPTISSLMESAGTCTYLATACRW
jgi:acetylcholinesterase